MPKKKEILLVMFVKNFSYDITVAPFLLMESFNNFKVQKLSESEKVDIVPKCRTIPVLILFTTRRFNKSLFACYSSACFFFTGTPTVIIHVVVE